MSITIRCLALRLFGGSTRWACSAGILGWTYCVLVSLLLATPVRAQCPGQWLPGGALAGLNGEVWTTTVWDPDGGGPQPSLLIAGGPFTTAGGNSATHIAAWNGTSWQALGSGIAGGNAWVLALCVYNGELIACGSFTTAGGNAASNIARWNGSTWQPLGTGITGDYAWALAVFNSELIAGGFFSAAGGTGVSNIARWNGTAWQGMSTGMTGPAGQQSVNALTAYNGGLVAGGSFVTAGGTTVNRIARWNGFSWSALGSGMNADIWALTAYKSDLIAGGSFVTAGGNTANRIARWNDASATWSAMGTGMNATVGALTTFGGGLIAGGDFTTANGSSANRIARWNTQSWQALGTGTNNSVLALAAYGSELIAGGKFTTAGGGGSANIAHWSNGACAPAILRVKAGAPAGGNGSSWATPYRFLQDALAAAVPIVAGGQPVQFWIAAGTYLPDRSAASPTGSGDRTATFTLDSNMAAYGGFNGTETTLGQRDPGVNVVVLNGDLLGNDFSGGNPDENSLHLLTLTNADATALVDGLTVSDAGSLLTTPDANGGGAIITNSSPTFRNCVFQRNKLGKFGGNGAAIYATGGSLTLDSCVFQSNRAGGGVGGGAPLGGAVYSDSALLVQRCTFMTNTAIGVDRGRGGAIYAGSGTATIEDSSFVGNVAGDDPGALYATNVVVRRCLFDSNLAADQGAGAGAGGGVYVGCTFLRNLGGFGGPALAGPAAVIGCYFADNADGTFAPTGAVTGVLLVANCVFVRNKQIAVSLGPGGIVVNSVFHGHTQYALNVGPGQSVSNCIFWKNGAAGGQDAEVRASAPGLVNYCYVLGLNGSLGGVGNIGSNPNITPRFSDPDGPDNILGTPDDDFRLFAGSPCIDAGSTLLLPPDTYDIDGDGNTTEPLPLDADLLPRIVNDPSTPDTGAGSPVVDMGAYEAQFPYSQWISASGGLFSNPLNWRSGAIPGPADRVALLVGGSLPIAFATNPSIYSLTLTEGDITLDLQGHTLTATAPTNAVVVRTWSAQPTTLRVSGGTLQASNVNIRTNSALAGNGTIVGSLVNAGSVSPNGSAVGTLTVNGSYKQTSGDGGIEQAGRLLMDVAGTGPGQADKLQINGIAELGGTLIINTAGFTPDPGSTFSIELLRATQGQQGIGRFAVALLPGLADGRFYRITYPEDGGGANLEIADLTGDIGFGTKTDNTVSGIVTAIAAGDLNLDGLPDLAVTTSDGFVHLLFNAGNDVNGNWLGFTGSQQISVGTAAKGVTIADFDPSVPGPNVAVSAGEPQIPNSVKILSRDGGGNWSVALTLTTGQDPRGLTGAVTGGNGVSGFLLVTNAGDNAFSVYQRTGAGMAFTSLPPVTTDIEPTSIDPFDMDNPKFAAVVVSNHGSNTVTMHEHLGNGSFAPFSRFTVGSEPVQVISSDFNNDGERDAATIDQADGTVSVLISDGAGSFRAAASFPVGTTPTSITAIDLDGDGQRDDLALAAVSGTTRVVQVLQNTTSPGDTTAAFTTPTDLTTTKPPTFVAAADVNADGRDDIIAVNGDGSEAPNNITGRPNLSITCLADFNRDTFIDGIDYDQFNIAFEAGDPAADINKDGFVDGIDYDLFNNLFEGGC